MFEGADTKLQDARTAIQRLISMIKKPMATNIKIKSGPAGVRGDLFGIEDPVAFSECFSSCVTQVRSVGDAIINDEAAKALPGFEDWRKQKKEECRNDDLMKFINVRRIDDFHYGKRYLEFTMNAYAFSSENIGANPSPNSILHIDSTGPYWIVDQGTPNERRIPCEIQEGIVFTTSIIDPPIMHKGKSLSSSDPVILFNQALQYYAELLFEAKNKFGK